MEIGLKIQDATGKLFDLKTLEDAVSFLSAEIEFWKGLKERVGGKPVANAFSAGERMSPLLSAMNSYKEERSAGSDSAGAEAAYQNIARLSTELVAWARKAWLYRGHDFIESMTSAFERSQLTGTAFYNLVILNKIEPLSSVDTLVGLMMSYEFLSQDESLLVKRSRAERKAFSVLRDDLENERSRLITDISAFRKDTNDWRAAIDSTFSAWFDRVQVDSGEWLADLKKKSEGSLSDHSQLFNQMADTARDRIQDLEDTYREKLRLAAPATYWKDRAKALGFQGGLWAVLLTVVSICVAIGAGTFFWAWLHRDPVPFGLQSLQGVALFGSTAAAAIFVIKTLSKLTFSAFHLQRDAEEREQLTHLYLALIREGALDVKSRDIVLQALFSRADSGLLAGDHGPTMPSPGDVMAGLSRIRPQ